MRWYYFFWFFVGSAFLVVLVYPSTPYIESIHTDIGFIPTTAKRGQIVLINRKYKVNKKVSVNITRRFQRTVNGVLEIYQLTSVKKVRYPGVYKQIRRFKIPDDIKPGKWQMVNTLCYTVVARERCYNTQKLTINIIK